MNKKIDAIIIIFMIFSVGMTISFTIEPETNNEGIKIMSFNIHQFFIQDPSSVSEKQGDYIFNNLLNYLEDEKPDIIGLQEAEGARFSSGHIQGVAWLAEHLNMYYYYGNPTSDQIYGNAILSKWKIIESNHHIFPRPEGIERSVVEVTIESPFGNINIFNTHFAISRFNDAQIEAARKLIEIIGDKKAIITGDFNVNFEDDAYFILNNSLVQSSVIAGYELNSTEIYTASAANPTSKIDYIWLTENDWEVIDNSFKVGGDISISDHLAVIVELIPKL